MPVQESSMLVSRSTRCRPRASSALGLMLECNDLGVVLTIPRDDFALLQGIPPGLSFHHLVDRQSLGQAFAFLAELTKEKSVFGWKLKIPLAGQAAIFYFGGIAQEGLLQIYGARTRGGLMRFSHSFRSGAKNPISKHVTPSLILNERELALQDRLSSAQNKLAHLQGLLSRKDTHLNEVIADLQEARSGLHDIQNLLPICSSCKKIRDEQGDWQQVETYFIKHAGVKFTHSVCPECAHKLYPGLNAKNSD